jgi:hypothetical protein
VNTEQSTLRAESLWPQTDRIERRRRLVHAQDRAIHPPHPIFREDKLEHLADPGRVELHHQAAANFKFKMPRLPRNSFVFYGRYWYPLKILRVVV